MVKQIILTQNNFGIPIELQFVSDTNSPIDLTDKIVEVAISYDGTIIDVLQATISSYTNGTAYIVTTTRHTSNVGLYTTFWSVKDKYGYITAQSDLYYYVKEEYNGAVSDSIEQNKGTIEDELDKINSSIEILDKENSSISKTLSKRIDNLSDELGSQLDTKINTKMETVNTKFESINAKINSNLHNITTNGDSINEIKTKMVTRADINSITRFDITEINSMLKVNEAFNNTKVLLSNGIVNFNCRLEEKTSHNNVPFNQVLFKIPTEFLPNCSYMFLDCKYGLYGKSPTFSGTVKINCETGTAMLESDGNILDGASISYIGAITIQATWYIDRNIGTGYKLITRNSNSRISYQLNQTSVEDDFIYYTYMNSEGYNIINKCNRSGDILETKMFDDLATDNHGILSLAIDKNGYIHLMGGGHSDFNNYYYRSTNPYSVSEFLKIHLSDSRKTYCHIFAHEDKILGAYRETIETNTNKDRIVYFEAPINVASLEGFKFTPLTVIKDNIQPSYPFNVYSDVS